MDSLIKNKLDKNQNGNKSSIINTTLYELIDTVISSSKPDEYNMSCFIVSHILNLSNVTFSKELAENIERC